jgi:hypothetical protein
MSSNEVFNFLEISLQKPFLITIYLLIDIVGRLPFELALPDQEAQMVRQATPHSGIETVLLGGEI